MRRILSECGEESFFKNQQANVLTVRGLMGM